MAELIRNRWTPSFEGMSRRDRQGCDYYAYLPDPLAGWGLTLPADLVADLADAEAAIRGLNASGTSHVSLEGLARFLLRAESVASSKIEGLEAGPRRLLDAEVALAQGSDAADRVAVEVLANIAAMEAAVSHFQTISGTQVHSMLLSVPFHSTEHATMDQLSRVSRSTAAAPANTLSAAPSTSIHRKKRRSLRPAGRSRNTSSSERASTSKVSYVASSLRSRTY